MADEGKRSRPPADSSSSRARQRFAPTQQCRLEAQNMMKCIAAVLVVLGTFMTSGATPHAPRTWAPIYEPHLVPWADSGNTCIAAKLVGGLSECLREGS